MTTSRISLRPRLGLSLQHRPPSITRRQNVGHVVRKGIELSGTYAAGQFSTSVSYGLLHAVDKETNERMNGITPQSANLKLAYAFPAQAINVWYRAHWSKGGESSVEDRATGKNLHFSSSSHTRSVRNGPQRSPTWLTCGRIAVVNLLTKEYRMLNGSYGSGRGVRLCSRPVLSTFHCAIDSSDEQSHAPLPPMPPMSRSPFNGSCRMPHIGADFAAELFGINFY